MLWKGLFKLEVRGVKQDFIPYVDIHGLLGGPCHVVRLPIHNGEIVHPGMMNCVGMVIIMKRSPEMFLKPLPKGLCRLPYILLITLQFVNPYLYITPLFCVMLYLSFRAARRLVMILSPLKWS